jgi:hypothetical protein
MLPSPVWSGRPGFKPGCRAADVERVAPTRVADEVTFPDFAGPRVVPADRLRR